MSKPYRILIVEDFEPFQRFLSSLLNDLPEVEIIAEASDGIEALEKAQQFDPDLILLDIGLPRLNGLEVAAQVRKLCPAAKILFVTQESSPTVLEAALATGAAGYIMKTEARRDLIRAVVAVLRGDTFQGRDFQNRRSLPVGHNQKDAVEIEGTLKPSRCTWR